MFMKGLVKAHDSTTAATAKQHKARQRNPDNPGVVSWGGLRTREVIRLDCANFTGPPGLRPVNQLFSAGQVESVAQTPVKWEGFATYQDGAGRWVKPIEQRLLQTGCH